MIDRGHTFSSNTSPVSVLLPLVCVVGLAVVGCYASEDTAPASETSRIAEPVQEAAPPVPSFDEKLLMGRWASRIDDPENDLSMELEVSYVAAGRFTIRGQMTSSDPSKIEDAYKNFEVQGNWSIEDDKLIEVADSSTFPLWRTGVKSTSTLKKLDQDLLVFERSEGATMTYTRITSS